MFVGPVLFLCKLSVVVFSCHVVVCLSELNHVVLKPNFTDLGHAVINKWFWLLMPSVWCFSDRNGLISHLLIIIFSRYKCSVALSCRSELLLCDFQDQVSSTQRASSPVWHNYLLLWTHLLSCSNPFPLIWTMFDTHHVPHTQRRRSSRVQDQIKEKRHTTGTWPSDHRRHAKGRGHKYKAVRSPWWGCTLFVSLHSSHRAKHLLLWR